MRACGATQRFVKPPWAILQVLCVHVRQFAHMSGWLRRAAKMRTALAAMLDGAKANDDAAFRLHPAYWGAFSIVGEGGR